LIYIINSYVEKNQWILYVPTYPATSATEEQSQTAKSET
jgi:hypothetical protein